jgi:hypothetical protein
MVRRMSMAASVAGLLAGGTACDFVAATSRPPPPPPPCSSSGEAPCPLGTVCEDDPDDDCDPLRAESCPGRCEAAPCGEFGLRCAEGQVCVDDPTDDCEPGRGRCPGVCASPDGAVCEGPGKTFVSHDPGLCAQILFICEVGWGPFYDGCGCGCQVL